MNSDVVILSGGLGTRLRPVVGAIQKTIVPVAGRPFLDIIIRYLEKNGFKRLLVCTGFGAEELEDCLSRQKYSLKIDFSHEEKPLGTAGALKHAESSINTEDFFLLNGDSFCEVNLAELLKFHKQYKALATLTVSKVKDPSDYGTVVLSEEGRVTGFLEKQPAAVEGRDKTGLVNAGVYCLSKQIFSFLPADGIASSLERDIFPKIIATKVYGYVTSELFLDIGTPERYEQAKRKFG